MSSKYGRRSNDDVIEGEELELRTKTEGRLGKLEE
jgi:hypothetical protein